MLDIIINVLPYNLYLLLIFVRNVILSLLHYHHNKDPYTTLILWVARGENNLKHLG